MRPHISQLDRDALNDDLGLVESDGCADGLQDFDVEAVTPIVRGGEYTTPVVKVAQIPAAKAAIGCGGCSSRWNGLETSHCAACHRTFIGETAFNKHRAGSHARGTAWNPAPWDWWTQAVRTSAGACPNAPIAARR